MDRYMRTRNPSVSFDPEVRTDSGHRLSIDEPLHSLVKSRSRGRSMMEALSDAQKANRSNSESNRDRYDPVTGRRRSKHTASPVRDEPHIGEARFPLLQQTVDEMARESQTNLTQATSLTTDSTVSPIAEGTMTPSDEPAHYALSPIPISPGPKLMAMSYESSRPFRRSASERWRNGETTTDFFSRAGSLRKTRKDNNSTRSDSRRDTISSTKSPSSVASSFLRGFSLSSGGDDVNINPAVDAEGQTIGEDYVIGKQIGFGGFSVIKEVTQISSETGQQRKLAVKIVRRVIDGKSEDENDFAQAEFEHEVELWRFLNHPNVLPLEAVYKLDEATFCFIPLNTGGTLFDLIRKNRGGISLEMARHYAFQIASALRYLHLDARVVHRDIKLENCLLDTTDGGLGIVRLCDFGMAEWLSHDTRDDTMNSPRSSSVDRPPQKFMGPADSSTAAFAGGSLEYAAPEIVRRATGETEGRDVQKNAGATAQRSMVSPAVDIWALGVSLFTMIMGKRPFSDSFMPRVVMAILAGDWDRDGLRDRLGDHEERVMDLIEGCMTMDEHQRWNIGEVIDCDWFEDEPARYHQDDDNNTGGWRL